MKKIIAHEKALTEVELGGGASVARHIHVELPLGATLLAIRPYSTNPGDDHLSVILAQKQDGKHVTWSYNWQSKGCAHGHYFSDETQALKDFCER